MRGLIIFIILFLASVFLGIKIAEDPGYALFVYRNWSMEMPLWFAIVTLLIFLFLFYLVMHFADSINFSIYRWKNWRSLRRKHKAYNKTNRGLIELIEGHWQGAEHYLLAGIDQAEAPLINYLAAAKAAHEQKNYGRRDLYLKRAHVVSPQADVAIGITQARLQLDEGQLTQALETLQRLESAVPKHPMVLKLLERVYVRMGDWHALLHLLPRLKKADVVDAKYYDYFESKIYCELLLAAQKDKTLLEIQEFWKKIPKRMRQDPEVLACYAKFLLPYPQALDELEVTIRAALKRKWNAELIRLYGLIEMQDSTKQLARAEKWLDQYSDQPALLLALGRISMRCQLWGKAKDYLESSIRIQPTQEAYFEYGRLLERLNDLSAAAESYRKGLLLH